MSEAELHILRGRLDGGIRNKAARGELRRGLPVGLVWGEGDGRSAGIPTRRSPASSPRSSTGSRSAGRCAGCGCGCASRACASRCNRPPTCAARGSPGSSRPTTRYITCSPTPPTRAPMCSARPVSGATSARTVCCASAAASCPRASGRYSSPSTIAGSSTGTPTRPTRPASAATPVRGRISRAPARSGRAARCCRAGHLRNLAASVYCGPPPTGTGQLVDGRGTRHLRVGGVAIDTAVAAAFLAALQPAALQACLAAAQQLEDGHDAALAQWRRQVEQARYHAGTAERRYRAVDPDNRLVARGLETEWNTALHQLADAENELARRETARPKNPDPARETGDPRPRRRPRRGVVGGHHHRQGSQTAAAHPAGRGRHRRAPRPRPGPRGSAAALEGRRDHRTVRAAQAEPAAAAAHRRGHHRPAAPAGRPLPGCHHRRDPQQTGPPHCRGLSFTASRVQSLRHHWKIPCHQPGDAPIEGEPLTVADAAHELGLAPSTLQSWLNEGFISARCAAGGCSGRRTGPGQAAGGVRRRSGCGR